MTKDYLLEVGMEEIPARFLFQLKEQLAQKVGDYLTEQGLGFEKIESFATPRRLAVKVMGMETEQADMTEQVKGPAMKIAKDEAGNWTKAALGFMRGQGVTEEAAFKQEIKGVDYLYVNKFIKGQSAVEILSHMDQVLLSMTFPVAMYWNQVTTPFIRPIHWIVSLLEDEVVPFTFVGIEAGRTTYGHRFLGEKVDLLNVASYQDTLKAQYVLVDLEERKALIEKQIVDLALENQWQVPIDSELLDEVTAIVEWPTVFYGQFDSVYLEVPEAILITAMKDHQRYFYAKDPNNQLLPVFISVRNGNDFAIDNVIKGNLKVLRARLEDALFFYQEDLKKDLAFYLNKLESVNEHFKLGTLADKQRRVEQLIPSIAKLLNLSNQEEKIALDASRVYKFDLMTQTVGEFDELQGEMGQVYGPHFGLSPEVSQVIGMQYLPKSSGGDLPQGNPAIALTLADKIDTLLHYFSVDLIPTGSNDPYGLRRQAMGLVEILLSTGKTIDLRGILEAHPLCQENPDLFKQVSEFIKARVQNHLEKDKVAYDIIKAVLSVDHLNLHQMVATAHELNVFKETEPETYRQVVEAITRVVNLGAKVEVAGQLDVSLSQTESEKSLMALTAFNPNASLVDNLKERVEPINTFFLENMVNDHDERIRQNRLGLMKDLTDQIIEFFDPSELISKF